MGFGNRFEYTVLEKERRELEYIQSRGKTMKKLDKRLTRWFLGKNAVIDERAQKELGIVSTRAVFAFFVFELLFALGVSQYAAGQSQAFGNLLYIIMFIQIIMTFVITYGLVYIPLTKKKLLRREISPEEKDCVTREIKHSWVKIAPLVYLLYWVLDTMINLGKNGFFEKLFSLKQIVSALIFTLIFSIGMYFYERKGVHVINDNE